MNEIVYREPSAFYYPEVFITRVVHGLLAIVEFLLALRLILTLLGAQASAPFVAWFYNLTGAIMAPFIGAFPAFSIAGFTLDLSIIFAMIGYAILGWLLVRLVGFFSYLR